jgi:hypothetical protein
MGFWDENWGLVWMIDGEGLGFNVSVLGFFMGRNLVERLGVKERSLGVVWGVGALGRDDAAVVCSAAGIRSAWGRGGELGEGSSGRRCAARRQAIGFYQ